MWEGGREGGRAYLGAIEVKVGSDDGDDVLKDQSTHGHRHHVLREGGREGGREGVVS